MLGEQFYSRIGKSRKAFFLFAAITILFHSGISFTFVIPGLKGFDLFFTILTFVMYFVAANIFVGVVKNGKWLLVIMISIIFTSLGMGWRLWLEWGEFSLVEHTSLAVYIGYPSVSAIIITVFYIIGNSKAGKKADSSSFASYWK